MKGAFFETLLAPAYAFFNAGLDRASERREDAGWLADMRARPDAGFVLIARDMPILGREDRRALWPLPLVEALGTAQTEVLLGLDPSGAPRFAALLPDAAVEMQADHSDGFLDRRVLSVPGHAELEPVDLRSIAWQELVAPEIVAVLGQAKAICFWHARHKFCAVCGAPTHAAAAGWRRECPACKAQHFPRTDPVVIMLATDGDRCLLGRQPRFPKGMYSALAGFLEPGETIEEAVLREIHEESGVSCDAVRYVGSQPWPFPSSLMIGCLARATTRDVVVDRHELEDARWFERAEVEAMMEKRHPERLAAPNPMAMAHHLLRVWLSGAAD